jgi:hypothetical protein
MCQRYLPYTTYYAEWHAVPENHPLSVQGARTAVLPLKRVRKLTTTINVQMVDG